MLPTSKPAYWFGDDKENVPLDKPSRFSESLSSSIWGTDAVFNIWKTPTLATPLTEPKNIDYVQTKTYPNSSDSLESQSPHSSGYGSFGASPWSQESFKIFSDELTKPIEALLKPNGQSPGGDEATNSSTSSFNSISYSLLSEGSSSDNFSPKSCFSDLTFDEFFKLSQPAPEFDHDELRRDFEMNGRTLEVDEEFTPHVSSTPMANRRSSSTFVVEPSLNQQIFYPPTPSPPRETHFYSRPRRTRRKFKPNKKSLEDHCVFCKNNGASEQVYRTHTVKDSMGRVLCPVLRQYKCPICGEDGDKSHTVKYCPKKPIITPEDLARMDSSQF